MTAKKTIIFHIDVNSAYLSWTAVSMLEAGETEDIRLIPSIIGGDQSKRRGVVLAKSIPAKKFAIQTGEPISDALKKCPSIKIIQPDHHLYAQYSQKLRSLLTKYATEISPYSIDECFLHNPMGAFDRESAVRLAHLIKDDIRDHLGFTVNIGISTNHVLAKMASDFQKPDRVHTLFPDEIEKKMWPLPVRELFMVGRASAARLNTLGIKTIGDLARTSPDLLTPHLKSHGQTIWEYANGIETTPITHDKETKGIGNSTTIAYDVTARQDAIPILKSLAGSVSRRLKKHQSQAGSITVEIKYNDFHSVSHQTQLNTPTNDETIIHQTALTLFDDLWDHTPIRLLGIRTSKLTDSHTRQLTLFDYQTNQKQDKLDSALQQIRHKYGQGSILKATDLISGTKEESPGSKD